MRSLLPPPRAAARPARHPALLCAPLLALAPLLACGEPIEPVTTDFENTSLAADWRGEFVYQLMVDRFANGDVNNDHRVVPGELGRYQGGDWQGVIDRIDYLRELGVTAVWISPVVRNVETDAGFDSYHGYWTQDFLDVNPHFGDLATLREMVDALHDAGILVILDIVTNHVGQLFYYDVNMNGRPDEWVSGSGIGSPVTRISEYDPDFDIRGVHSFTSLGEAGLAPIRFFDLPEINRVPPEPELFANPDWYWRRGRVTVWGRESDACRDAGIDPDADWNACYAYVREQEVTGDFPGGLKDLRTDLPEVREALIDVMTWWIRSIDVDGFRIDTVKHIEHDFWIQFSTAIRERARALGKENFLLFGEVFDGADWLLGSYTAPGMLDSVFYFSQKFTVYDGVFKYGAPTSRIEELWNERDSNWSAAGQPGGIAGIDGELVPPRDMPVNFLDNHDTARFLYDVRSDAQGLDRLHLALALLFTEEGVPCLYYGTEQQFAGGNDPANRLPLWLDSESAYDTENSTFRWIRDLAATRRSFPELQYGTQRIHWSTSRTGDEADAGIFAFERRFRGLRALVVLNTNPTHASVTSAESLGFGIMGTTFPADTLVVDVTPGGNRDSFRVTADGCGMETCDEPVPDDWTGPPCGCLAVQVPPLSARILVERSRADEAVDSGRPRR